MSLHLRVLILPVMLLLVGMTGNAFAANNTLSVSAAPPASSDAGVSFNVTASLPYVFGNDCGNQVRVVVTGGSCSGGNSSWTGSTWLCQSSGSITRSITMSAGALNACVISVDGEDSNSANGEPASVVYTVKINQSIAWSGVPVSSLMTSADYAVVATAKTSDGVANTGMAITYTSNTPSVCTVTAGGVVHNVAAGTCTIQADAASSGNFVAKTSTASWSVIKASQTITVTTPAPANAAYGDIFTVAAAAPGGVVVVSTSGGCSNVGNNVTMTSGTQDCVVRYNQGGNGSYNAAPEVTSTTLVVQDIDLDGAPDATDNCPLVANPGQANNDGDAEGDACDTDDDNDSILDAAPDNCQFIANADQADADTDGVGNVCDPDYAGDTDGDGVVDVIDNCPVISNPVQTDTDGDGIGDVCDTTPNGDTDNDGVDNNTDNCPLVSNPAQTDTDTDGIGDACDSTPNGDDDSDGIDNNTDNCPAIANADQLDTDSDGTGDACDTTPNGDPDGDGVDSGTDNCPLVANADQVDTDGDGVGDACDEYPNDPGVLARGWGEVKKDVFGSAVANAGDVNGDGHDDVVVGAYRWDVAKTKIPPQKKLTDIGKVYIYSGADGSLLHTIKGQSAGDWFGYSVAGADINNDGYSDIIVGAHRDDVLNIVTNKLMKDAGSVYVYSGNPADNYIELRSFHGEAVGDNLGFNVANAGDTNNDGNADVIYGVPKADPDGLANAGIAVVRSGATGEELLRIKGEVKGNWLGRAVGGAGDVNNDGHDDVIVGMPKDDVLGVNAKMMKDAGSAAVYSGADGGSKLFKVEGEGAGDWFGFAAAGANDLDGDGQADVVVGAYRHDPFSNGKLLKDAGAVYAYRYDGTAVGQRLFKAPGQAKGDWLGYSVDAGADLDNDSDADIVAGAPRRDRINPLTGKPLKDVGAVFGFDGAGVQLFEHKGYRTKDNYGWSLASAGDIDLDGYADIISSTPRADKVDPITNKLLRDIGMMEVISGKYAYAIGD